MRYTIGAGTYFGIPVRIHFTFPLILVAFGVDAGIDGGWIQALRAVVLILAVFVCVILHEFGHSLQVKRYGITVRDIVLLPIGGMARAERIPEEPWREIVVAISGPLVNFALVGIIAGVLFLQGASLTASDGFLIQLLFINLVLGTFNLIPAYPMDGGRILRALLATRMSYLRATRVARAVGQIIAVLFVVIGFTYSSLIMLPVIAVFIFAGAMSEEKQIRIRHILTDRPVGDLLRKDRSVFRLEDSVASAFPDGQPSPPAIAATDETGAVTGAVSGHAARQVLKRGAGAAPLATIAVFDFPVFHAQTPAIRAYYLLQADRKPFGGVVDDGKFLGLVHSDEFLDGSE